MDVTYCYADLAGSVAVPVMGDVGAADAVARFTEAVDDALGDRDRLLRMNGDAVMVACGDPDSAVVFVSTLFELAAGEPALSNVRAGLHHGHTRTGENPEGGEPAPFSSRDDEAARAALLAARLALEARRGQVLATVAVAEAAAAAGVETTKLGDFELRGVPDAVTIFELDVAAADSSRAEDPVCRIEVERDRAPARLRHDAVAYYFCSLECACEFAREPARYAFD